jgi:hypothetical protein
MTSAETATLSGRDRAVLRAVAAGRCELGSGGWQPVLLIDGLACADSAAGHRLVAAGLINPPDPGRPLGPANITMVGWRALGR